MVGFKSKRLLTDRMNDGRLHTKPVGLVLDRLDRIDADDVSRRDVVLASEGSEQMKPTYDDSAKTLGKTVQQCIDLFIDEALEDGKPPHVAAGVIIGCMLAHAGDYAAPWMTREDLIAAAGHAYDEVVRLKSH